MVLSFRDWTAPLNWTAVPATFPAPYVFDNISGSQSALEENKSIISHERGRMNEAFLYSKTREYI